jgi:hypothetical protein
VHSFAQRILPGAGKEVYNGASGAIGPVAGCRRAAGAEAYPV